MLNANRPVVVAVVTMRIMQMAIGEIVDVVAMRDRLMPATCSMLMPLRMRATVM